MKSKKAFTVFVGLIFLVVAPAVLAAPIGLSLGISPATIDWTSNAWVTVTVSNLTAGAKVDIGLYVDVQSNGTVDVAVDPLIASFRVQDGVTNPLGSSVIVDDEDGSANGTVVSRLAYFGQEGAFHIIGNYLWQIRTVSGGTSVVARFSVTQPTSTVWIAGSVVNYVTTSPVPAAAVWLGCFGEENTPVVWTGTNGAFKLYLPSGVSTADVERVGAMGLGYFNPGFDDELQEPISEYVFTNDLHAGVNSLPIALRVVPKVSGMIFEISGHVYDDQTNALPGVMVCAEWNDGDDESTAITDTNGLYRLCMWGDSNTNFLESPYPIIYADEESLMRLGLVSVTSNLTVTSDMTGVDLYCPRATLLARGKVLAADNSNPIVNATVWFENDMFSSYGVSLADGTYEVGLRPSTGYDAYVDSYSIASQGFLGAWTNVSIASGPFTNAQFRLERGYIVSGHIYDANTNELTGGYVGARPYPSQNSWWDYYTGVNRHGAYHLLAPTGELAVGADDFYGFIGQQYPNPVTNTTAGVVGIDFYLEPGAIISGQVLEDGNPLAYVQVDASIITVYPGGMTSQGIASTDTDANGYYTLFVPPGGEYGVSVWRLSGGEWLGIYYSNTTDATSATLVSPTLDMPVNNINFALVGSVAPPQYTYTTNDGSITITGYIGSGGDIIIPDTIEGLPVAIIGNYAFESCTNLTSATIPNSVVNLGEGAFGGCTGLTGVTIGTNVTNVGDWTFASCSGLTNITIPNSTTNIGSYAFNSCTSLANVTIGNSVRSLADFGFADCTSLTNVTIGTNVTSIGEGTFARCVGLTRVTIPNSVTSLGQGDSEFYSGVFHYCTGLTNVTIGNGVTNIGWMTFVNCTSLTSVTIGTNVTVIGGRAFFTCSSLANVIIPNRVVSIGNMAFNFCASLTNVVIGTNVTTLGSGAFGYCTSLTAVTIPGSVTSYGIPFVGCNSMISIAVDGNNSIYSSLDGVVFNKTQTVLIEYPGGKSGNYTIPSSVNTLGALAFHSCAKLTGISIPYSITSIGSTAFSGCFGLTNVTIPSSVTNMEYGVFFNCPGLTSVTIGNGLVSMGNSVFYNCPGLVGVYFMGNAPSLGGSATFYNANNATVYRVSGATGWPTVPDAWAGRPTALWQPQASDADADGIPDSWEQQYFGGITNVNPDAKCSNGVNTIREAYVAGFNPTNSSERFGITGDAKNRTLQWNAVSGRLYNVYYTTNLLNGFQPLATNYIGGAITDSLHSTAGKCFYKIDVRLAP